MKKAAFFVYLVTVLVMCLHSPSQSKELLYSLSTDQVYKSANGGASWDGLYIESATTIHYNDLAIDNNNRILYIASGNGILKSADGGSSWDKIYPLGSKESFNAFAISYDDPSCIYAATSLYLYFSPDKGRTWVQSDLPQRETYFIAAFSREKIVYAAGNKKIFMSSDNGKHWILVNSNLSQYISIEDMAVNPRNSREIYLCTAGALYRTTDSGAKWWLKKTSHQDWIIPAKVVFSPVNPGILYILSIDRKASGGSLLRMSRDAGATWFTIASKEEIRTFGVSPVNSAQIYYLGASTMELSGSDTMFRNIFTTSDSGKNWKELQGILPGSELIKKILVRPW
jgi:photosystem II stability/assembly factor-like uncharacterized protein